MSELKPCPFCGGDAELKQYGNPMAQKRGMIAECKTLGCQTSKRVFVVRRSLEWAADKVIERWNTRAKQE